MKGSSKDAELVTVFTSMDLGLIAVVKSILQGSGIFYYAKGESLQGLFGAGNIGFNIISGPVEIQVRSEDAEDAKILLGDL